MFGDITQLFTFGKELEAHGEKWEQVLDLLHGYRLAVKRDATLPCPVFVVQVVDVNKREEQDEA
jgi:hypothetical protein